jgi:hypothetical protein
MTIYLFNVGEPINGLQVKERSMGASQRLPPGWLRYTVWHHQEYLGEFKFKRSAVKFCKEAKIIAVSGRFLRAVEAVFANWKEGDLAKAVRDLHVEYKKVTNK